MKQPKTRNGGKWTESEYENRIKNCLRKLSEWWGPANKVLREAKTGKDTYRCNICKLEGPQYLPPLSGRGKRRCNAIKDHIYSVVALQDSRRENGQMDWNKYIDRLLVEEGFQILCHRCHTMKSNKENKLRGK